MLQSISFAIAFWAWSIIANIVFLPTLVMPRPAVVLGQRVWAHGVTTALKLFAQLDVEVRGKINSPKGPHIIAAKHQSAWDTIIFHVLAQDPAIVMKQELLKIPIYGWYCKKSKMIPIDRSTGLSSLKRMIASCKAAAKANRPIVIFPQGTRVAPGVDQPYLSGVTALYKYLNLPVVPVALNSGLFWPNRGITCKRGTIVIEFLEPIGPGLSHKTFAVELRQRIEDGTEKLVAEAQRNFPHTIRDKSKS